ncbi:MAG: endolytic transglycosylase MltG [Flavobacteriales bacterium]|nr:endolytic transglycosylase MltG [Flavobacteriales bacterium]
MTRPRTWALVLVLVLSAMLSGWYGYRMYQRIMVSPFFHGPGVIPIQVPTGASMAELLQILAQQEAATDTALFRAWSTRRGFLTPRPGNYLLVPGSSLNDLVLKLRSGEQDPVRLTLHGARNMEEVAAKVAKVLEPSEDQLLHAFRDTSLLLSLELRPEEVQLVFLPNTYEFWWNVSAEGFLRRMVREHRSFWTEERSLRADSLGLTPFEVGVLASIVEAETNMPEDAPIVAGVYLNRLRIDMPLQADPTLKFALRLDSVARVLDRDKGVVSPYNTYTHRGLPPGPIRIPGPRSIDAVLFAPRHKFLYFCAKEDLSGYSHFSKSYSEHLQHARRYQRALNARRIFR